MPMLFQCWATICDAGPTFKHHCVTVLCLLGSTHLSLPRLRERNKCPIYLLIQWASDIILVLLPYEGEIPRKHKISTRFWFYVGTASTTLSQHEIYIGSMSYVCCVEIEVITCSDWEVFFCRKQIASDIHDFS